MLQIAPAGSQSPRDSLLLSGARMDVEFTFAVDHTVLADRRERRAGPVTNLEVLNLLLRLPVGQETRVNWSDYELRLVTPHLGAALDLGLHPDGHIVVTRWLRPALDVDSALIARISWDGAIAAASKYAPYCQRQVILGDVPDDDHAFWWEANYYGVGVMSESGRELLEASPFSPRQYTGASWKFAEQILARTDLVTI
jgi:hypothetical protein